MARCIFPLRCGPRQSVRGGFQEVTSRILSTCSGILYPDLRSSSSFGRTILTICRRAAKRLKLPPVGSLGIVVKAYRLRYIPLSEAERRIADLYDVNSLFVTRAIVELAIEQLHERSV